MVIEFEKSVLKTAKKVFKLRGSIKKCAEATLLDRTTISRAVKAGTGEETTVNPITEYLKSIPAA